MFEQVKQMLQQKYGAPAQEIYQISHTTDNGLDEMLPDEYFYACLMRSDARCAGLWSARWMKKDRTIANLDILNASYQGKDGQPIYAGRLLIDMERAE